MPSLDHDEVQAFIRNLSTDPKNPPYDLVGVVHLFAAALTIFAITRCITSCLRFLLCLTISNANSFNASLPQTQSKTWSKGRTKRSR